MKNRNLLSRLIEQFPEYSRDALYSRIMCGEVEVNGERIVDPSFKVTNDSELNIIEKKYVSRGGLKLEAALENWNIEVKGKVFLDAGSSTGGFTDCLLQKGAETVYAVDVGYNQLAWSIRNSSKVRVHEKCNIMHFDKPEPPPYAAVADLSFRSISGAASHILDLTTEKWLLALIKPQFEIDSAKYPDFKGVIRDKKILKSVILNIVDKIRDEGLIISKVMLSPIKGRKGNIEFFFLIRDKYSTSENNLWTEKIERKLNSLIDGFPDQTAEV